MALPSLPPRNFLALKSYNYADLYALFVGHLADRIAGGKPFETPWAKLKPMREKDVMEMQEKLDRARPLRRQDRRQGRHEHARFHRRLRETGWCEDRLFPDGG